LLLSDREYALAAVVVAVDDVVADVVVAKVVVGGDVDFFLSSMNLVYVRMDRLRRFFAVASFAFPTIEFVRLFELH
jgi:hypothetical protein